MADELTTMEFEVSRIQEIGKALCELGDKYKASSFELMLALTGEVCRKYHRNKSENEMTEVLSRLIPVDAKETA